MAFLDKSKANYAFKALLGKAHTSAEREFANESILSGVTAQSSRIWADSIAKDAATAITDGVVTQVTGVILEPVSGAVAGGIQSSYRLKLGVSVPAGLVGKVNPLTGLEYSSGDYIGGVIPEAFGNEGSSDYRPILYNNSIEVPPLDSSDWFLDPFGGVVTREGDADSSVAWSGPMTMDCYIYVGQTVSEAIENSAGFTPYEGLGITISPSGDGYIFSVDDYIGRTEVVSVSGDLQFQIDSLTAASSGGIVSINGVLSPAGNIDIVTNTTEITITPDNGSKEISIDVDFSDYATNTLVVSVSGDLQTLINDLETDLDNYTLLTTTEAISSNLQSQINDLETDLDNYTLLTTTESISSNLQSQINDLETDLDNYTLLTTTESISSNLHFSFPLYTTFNY
jgi:hypothetical protein